METFLQGTEKNVLVNLRQISFKFLIYKSEISRLDARMFLSTFINHNLGSTP